MAMVRLYYYFTNGAGAGNMAQSFPIPIHLTIFLSGRMLKPCRDVSGDGLLDLLIGEQNNELNLFCQYGHKNKPGFGNVPDQEKNLNQLFTTTDFNTFNNNIAFYHDGKKMAILALKTGD